jgi:hypothetical protein
MLGVGLEVLSVSAVSLTTPSESSSSGKLVYDTEFTIIDHDELHWIKFILLCFEWFTSLKMIDSLSKLSATGDVI